MTMYRLSKVSGVAKTTVIDICSGKSSIGEIIWDSARVSKENTKIEG